MSQVKNICKKYGKDPNDPQVVKIKKMLQKHMGYFPKMAEWVFTDKSTITELRNIMDLLGNVKISKPITSFNSSEELYDHLTEVQNKRKLNQIVKSIPSKSRKNVSKRIKDLIYNNLDKEEMFKDFFSKKGGSCKTEDDIYQMISEIINLVDGDQSYTSVLNKIDKRIKSLSLSIGKKITHYIRVFFAPPITSWSDFISFRFIKNIGYEKDGEIVYKDGKTIIVEVNKFSLSAAIGSSHWCISTRPTYWNSYAGNKKLPRSQYFIYQTEYKPHDKRSLLGFTINIDGTIYAAHYKNDDPIANMDRDFYMKKYGRYLKPKDVKIESVEKFISLKLTNFKILTDIPNWGDIFRSYNMDYKSTEFIHYHGYRDRYENVTMKYLHKISENLIETVMKGDGDKFNKKDIDFFFSKYFKIWGDQDHYIITDLFVIKRISKFINEYNIDESFLINSDKRVKNLYKLIKLRNFLFEENKIGYTLSNKLRDSLISGSARITSTKLIDIKNLNFIDNDKVHYRYMKDSKNKLIRFKESLRVNKNHGILANEINYRDFLQMDSVINHTYYSTGDMNFEFIINYGQFTYLCDKVGEIVKDYYKWDQLTDVGKFTFIINSINKFTGI